MAEFKEIDDFLLQDCQGKFKDKSWFFGLFGSKVYTVTGEKVEEGFRYFACEAAPLLQAFSAGSLAAIMELPFALDDDGEVDTSSLLINLCYTASGSMVAMQVEQYQNYDPKPVSPVVLLEGPQAQSVIAQVKELDQTH